MLCWGEPSHQGCPDSSELAEGKTKSAGPWRLQPSLPLGTQGQEDQSSAPEPLARVVGAPAGRPHPVKRDGSGSGLKRHSGHSLPQPVCWALVNTSWVQVVQTPWLQRGKRVAWAIEMNVAPPPPRELSMLSSCESQCWLLPLSKELKGLRQQAAAAVVLVAPAPGSSVGLSGFQPRDH